MSRFRVRIEDNYSWVVEVEADDEEHAEEIGRELQANIQYAELELPDDGSTILYETDGSGGVEVELEITGPVAFAERMGWIIEGGL